MRDNLTDGYSLLEFMTVMTVIGIMMTVGIPSFLNIISKHHLKSATETIYGGLQLARMEAIKRNRNISFSFQTSGTESWCFAMHDNSNCDCTISNSCKIDNHPAAVTTGMEFGNVYLTTNLKSNSTSFNPIRGTSNSGSISLSLEHISSKLIVSSRGRIRVCSDHLMDYPRC